MLSATRRNVVRLNVNAGDHHLFFWEGTFLHVRPILIHVGEKKRWYRLRGLIRSLMHPGSLEEIAEFNPILYQCYLKTLDVQLLGWVLWKQISSFRWLLETFFRFHILIYLTSQGRNREFLLKWKCTEQFKTNVFFALGYVGNAFKRPLHRSDREEKRKRSANGDVVSRRACLPLKYLISWPPGAKCSDLRSPESRGEEGAINVPAALGSTAAGIKSCRASRSAAAPRCGLPLSRRYRILNCYELWCSTIWILML